MTWLFYSITAIVLIIIAFYIISVRTTRCPKCGTIGVHKIDRKTLSEQKKARSEANKILGEKMTKRLSGNQSPYMAKPFICKKCGQKFDRDKSMYWWDASKKYGKQFSIVEYKKMEEETERMKSKLN